MATDTDGPSGAFKRSLAMAMRTIAEDPEMTVTFGADQPSLAGNRCRLPQIERTVQFRRCGRDLKPMILGGMLQ